MESRPPQVGLHRSRCSAKLDTIRFNDDHTQPDGNPTLRPCSDTDRGIIDGTNHGIELGPRGTQKTRIQNVGLLLGWGLVCRHSTTRSFRLGTRTHSGWTGRRVLDLPSRKRNLGWNCELPTLRKRIRDRTTSRQKPIR